VEKGKAGGGLCFGYRVVKKLAVNGEPIRGEREIVASEAITICRIFGEFAAGKSPRAIAVDLNREGVPGPLGRAWGIPVSEAMSAAAPALSTMSFTLAGSFGTASAL